MHLAFGAAEDVQHLPAIDLPPSSYFDAETRTALERERREADGAPHPCPNDEHAGTREMPAIRVCEAEAFYRGEFYRRLRTLFAVNLKSQTLGGVATEVFTPAQGIAAENNHRVLINVHGGGFLWGARTTSHLESIPIAALGRIKVVSIDYRQAPEFKFPAASEDVASVYRELLKHTPAANIGIFGCSAGGLLTAESMAWFKKEHLPRPGAIGLFCEGAGYWMEGDSGRLFGASLLGGPIESIASNPYFQGVAADNPLAFPVRSAATLREFPPTLFIAGSRDFALSSVLFTHEELVQQGVEAELHVFEGMNHAFFFDPDLPQSREVHRLTVRFFDTHLGR
jgi:monoterpene epsilon-lactone hydrolase